MTNIDGILTQISVGTETVWGTPVTPTVSIPVKPSTGMVPKQDVGEVEAIDGTPAKVKSFYKGKLSHEGDFAVEAYPNMIGHFLKSVLGAVADAQVGGETIVYKHTITEAVAKPSLTLEQNAGALCKRYSGFTVSDFKLSTKVGSTVEIAIKALAKSQADSTPITAAYETTRPFNWTDIVTVSIGGTNIVTKIQDLEVEYKNNLSLLHGLSSSEPVARYVKQSMVTGKMTLFLDDATKAYYASLLATTEAAIVIDMLGDTIGSSSKNELKITIPKAAITKFDTKLGFDYNAITIEFSGRRDASAGLLTAELTNVVASY